MSISAPDSMLTSTELNLLLDIGEQCPEVGGHVVWRARTLLENWMEVTWVDDELCNTSPILSSAPKATSLRHVDMRIYPIPASNHVFILPGRDVQIVQLDIIDMTGRLVIALSPSVETTLLQVDVSNLTSGNYRIKATFADGITSVKPLVIAR